MCRLLRSEVRSTITLIEFTNSILQDKIVYQEGSLDPVVGQGYYTFCVLQCKDGEANVVWPDSMKETDIVVPDKFK